MMESMMNNPLLENDKSISSQHIKPVVRRDTYTLSPAFITSRYYNTNLSLNSYIALVASYTAFHFGIVIRIRPQGAILRSIGLYVRLELRNGITHFLQSLLAFYYCTLSPKEALHE